MRIRSAGAKKGWWVVIANWNEKDEWSSLADFLANLIEKYADALDLEHLPEPPHELNANEKGEELLKHEPIESYKTA